MTFNYYRLTKKILYVTFAVLFLFWATCFCACADGEEIPDVIIENDFRNEGIWGYEYIELNNVVTDPAFNTGNGGHRTFGVVPGAVWGAYVSEGNGYLTYRVCADKGLCFEDLTVNFSAFLGHKNIKPYIGEDKTNLTVAYSFDNVDFKEVFSLYKTVEINDGEEYFRSVDLTEFAAGKSLIYIRINLIHLAWKDFPLDLQQSGIFNQKHEIVLQRLGVRLFSVKITAKQTSL